MSETPQNVRIVLGPVARQLIDGAGENRPKALDDAITALLEGQKSGQAEAPEQAPLDTRLASLEAAMARQTEALRNLSYTASLELKMTRILIASLMSEGNEDQRTLLALASQATDEVQSKLQLLGDSEIEKLRENEASVQTAILRDLERGGMENEPAAEAEIER